MSNGHIYIFMDRCRCNRKKIMKMRRKLKYKKIEDIDRRRLVGGEMKGDDGEWSEK